MVELAAIEGGRGASGNTGLPTVTAPPSPSEWTAMKQQASVIARSGLAPKAVSTPEKILVIAMKARELSLPPMQGLSHIHIVEGRPALSAELMVALVQRAGHKLRVLETSSQKCVVEGLRADDPRHPSRVEWTMEDAQRAGVANKGPWKSYPAAMLRARAISALCRFAFADVLMGAAYVPEELGAEVNEEGEVLSVPDQGEAPQRTEEPVEEAEVVEEQGRVHPEHRRLLDELARLERRIPPQHRPESTQLWNYASAKYGNARAALDKLNGILENLAETPGTEEADEPPFDPDPDPPDDGEPPVNVEEMRGAAKPAPAEQAEESPHDRLRALAKELAGEHGVELLEKRAGKEIKELTDEEVGEWSRRLGAKGQVG